MHTCMWSLVAALGCSGFKVVHFFTSEIRGPPWPGGWTGMHCALQKKRDTTFCTSHCSPACRPYKSAVLMWCLCLSSTSWCALVQEHQRWDYTVGKGEASGFSAPSSLALATSFSKLFLLPWPQDTNSACVACVLQCNSYEARLLWFLISAFSHMKPFLPFVNRF